MNPTTMPPLGLGTWELTGSTCVDAVAAGIEMGYRHIDTAQMYGNEADVGEGIARADIDRDQLWVTTKLDNHNHAPDKVIASTEDSLRHLGLDRVDLLLIHWTVELDELEETLEAMQELGDRDLVSNLGVSNFTLPRSPCAGCWTRTAWPSSPRRPARTTSAATSTCSTCSRCRPTTVPRSMTCPRTSGSSTRPSAPTGTDPRGSRTAATRAATPTRPTLVGVAVLVLGMVLALLAAVRTQWSP